MVRFFGAKGSRAPRSTNRRGNLRWAGLVLFSALVALLSAGYALGLLGDWGALQPSLNKVVTSSAGDGNTDVTGKPSSIDNSEGTFVVGSVETLANPPAGASERKQVERLLQLMAQSEKTWAEGYKAERERADGIARDLANVRAELTNRAVSEAALRAEVARMAKLLEAKETWNKKLASDRKKSKGVAKDSASSGHTLTDRAAAPTVYAVQSSPPTSSSTGMAKREPRKPAKGIKRQTRAPGTESPNAKSP